MLDDLLYNPPGSPPFHGVFYSESTGNRERGLWQVRLRRKGEIKIVSRVKTGYLPARTMLLRMR